jgi:hypothetical protein
MGVVVKFLLVAGALLVLWFMVRARFRIKVVDEVAAFLARAKTPPPPPPARVENLVKCAKCGAYHPAGKPCVCAGA